MRIILWVFLYQLPVHNLNFCPSSQLKPNHSLATPPQTHVTFTLKMWIETWPTCPFHVACLLFRCLYPPAPPSTNPRRIMIGILISRLYFGGSNDKIKGRKTMTNEREIEEHCQEATSKLEKRHAFRKRTKTNQPETTRRTTEQKPRLMMATQITRVDSQFVWASTKQRFYVFSMQLTIPSPNCCPVDVVRTCHVSPGHIQIRNAIFGHKFSLSGRVKLPDLQLTTDQTHSRADPCPCPYYKCCHLIAIRTSLCRVHG